MFITKVHQVVVVMADSSALLEFGIVHRILTTHNLDGEPLYSLVVVGNERFLRFGSSTPLGIVMARAETIIVLGCASEEDGEISPAVCDAITCALRFGTRTIAIGHGGAMVPQIERQGVRYATSPRLAIHMLLEIVEADHGVEQAASARRRLDWDGTVSALGAVQMQCGLEDRLVGWVDANLKRGASVDEMARRVGVSRRSFQRHFRAAVGISPYQWLLERRYKWCRQLLVNSNLTLAAIADQVGFGSATNLRRHFTHRAGVTPGVFRIKQTSLAFSSTDWGTMIGATRERAVTTQSRASDALGISRADDEPC